MAGSAASNDEAKGSTAYDKAEALFGVAAWMCCSVGMLLCNKQAIHAFQVPCTLVGIQFLFTALIVVATAFSTIHIGSTKDVLRWCRVVPFFSGMILTSILALKDAPMTLVITMRALSPLIGLPIEMCFPTPIRLSLPMIIALLGTLLGLGIYLSGMDLANDSRSLIGIFWALANNALAVADRMLQRLMLASDQEPVDISKTGVTLLNNVLGVIPLLIGGLLSNEFASVPEAVQGLDGMKLFWVVSSCFVGAGISYTGIWVASLISATSFLVLINANKFFIIFIEAFIMKKKELSAIQIVGATISILASIAYGKARDVLAKEDEADEEDEDEDEDDDQEAQSDAPLKK